MLFNILLFNNIFFLHLTFLKFRFINSLGLISHLHINIDEKLINLIFLARRFYNVASDLTLGISRDIRLGGQHLCIISGNLMIFYRGL